MTLNKTEDLCKPKSDWQSFLRNVLKQETEKKHQNLSDQDGYIEHPKDYISSEAVKNSKINELKELIEFSVEFLEVIFFS